MIALDTSGKLSQFPIVVVAVKTGKTKIMDALREKVSKRHKGLASRRRIKSSDLTDNELKWFLGNVDFPFRAVQCSGEQYTSFKAVYQDRKKWDFEFLAFCYFFAISGLAKRKEEVILDKDYDEKSMIFLISRLKDIFKKFENLEIDIRIADERNEYVALADLIAGTARRGMISSVKPNIVELAVKYHKIRS